jgi:hypothetical protein
LSSCPVIFWTYSGCVPNAFLTYSRHIPDVFQTTVELFQEVISGFKFLNLILWREKAVFLLCASTRSTQDQHKPENGFSCIEVHRLLVLSHYFYAMELVKVMTFDNFTTIS